MRDPAPNPFAAARFLHSCAQLSQLPDDTAPELVFAVRSNAGKSSALNRLCGQQGLARVSKTPGRTQLINLFAVPQGRLVDLPGYGFAKVSRDLRQSWGELIGRYLASRANVCGLIIVMDLRHPLMPQDRQLLDWVTRRGLPCHLLLTKADKLGRGAAKNVLLAVQRETAALPGVSAQLLSAHKGDGVEAMRERASALLAATGGAHKEKE
jgi:GTP-binding protein